MSERCVLVVGGGGREHAICKGLFVADSVSSIHCTPGNAGTSDFATNHDVSVVDIEGLISLASNLACDLVIAGPEAPLCTGLADGLALVDIPCFGPIAALAHLEGSKVFAKQIMAENGVPTAPFILLDSSADIEVALDGFSSDPWVVKRDILAGGKGVVVTEDRAEAKDFILDSISSDGHVLLEGFLAGEEASLLVVMDGSGYVCLPPSQDHKREFEGDKGRNTGGMGAYAPAPVYTAEVQAKVIERVVEPMHSYLSNLQTPYRGVLYIGLMIDSSGDPYVVEFNVRFGDPECQVTIPLIASDLGDLLAAAANDELHNLSVEFHNACALTVVLAAEGYPGPVANGKPITGISACEGGWVNHAATGIRAGELVSTGGRVLTCTGISTDLKGAASIAYSLIDNITLQGSHHRRDIGHRAL
jgi:phosphoribosylamine--glycine ligase